jgi:hypothetical protein
MAPGLPIAITIVNDKIVAKASYFATGSRFTNERIGNVYYLKYEGNYISFVNNAPAVVDEIVALSELIYIEPYFSGIFHIKYKDEYLCSTMGSQSISIPIKLQWAMLNISHSVYEQEVYIDTCNLLPPCNYDYVSVDGFDLLNPTRSFLLIPDGNFNMHLNYNHEEYIFKFQRFESNTDNKLMFIETNEGINIYSEELGYLQVKYDEDNEEYYPVFGHDRSEYSIFLEQARLYTTYYLKYENSYVKLVQREGVYYGTITNDIEEASIFQAISEY